MTRPLLRAILIAGMVLLAGCTGGVSDTSDSLTTSTNQTSTAAPTTYANQTDASPTADSGTIAFYVSDEENAIGDFQSLNVTVTRVGFERVAGDGGGWVEHGVENVTVDLTQLRGANATLVDEYDVPNGIYSKVFLHVSDVNATLQSGKQVRVKLPSEKLRIKNEFSVDNGSQVNFVFDIAVHKAGKSGKYILKPVISESGTDVPIESKESQKEEGMSLQFVGNVSRGENATIEVTRDEEPVENATVLVNEVAIGTTDTHGRITFGIPDDEKMTVTVTRDDDQAELEVAFEHEGKDVEQTDEKGVATLNATFVGNVSQGKNATVSVTQNGSAVANATIIVNDEVTGTTGANGELTFDVPHTETLTVTVRVDGEEVELEREFEAADTS